jgi:hypothetical protein
MSLMCRLSGSAVKRRPPFRLRTYPLPVVLLLISYASISGCATVPSATMSGGAELARAGEAAALQMQQNVTISEQSLALFRQAAAFNDGFNATPGASAQFVQNVETIQSSLAQYGALLQSLASAYSAMDELAEYGGASSFDSAMSSLSSDAQQFGNKIGKSITISSGVTKGIQEGGNVLIGSIQTKKVVQASTQIESVLKQVIAALSDPNVRGAMLPIQPELQGEVDQAALVMYTQGVYSYRPIVDSLGAPLGLQSVSNADAIVRANGRLQAGLSRVVNETMNNQIAAAQKSYEAGLAALKALLKQHHSLEAGEPVTVHNILGLLGRLKALAQVAAPQTAGGSK